MRLDLYDDPQTCSGRRMSIQRESIFAPNTKTPSVVIPANGPVTFTLLSGGQKSAYVSQVCAPTVTFVPVPDIEYHAEMVMAPGVCQVRLRGSGLTGPAVPSAQARKWRNGVSEYSSFCSDEMTIAK